MVEIESHPPLQQVVDIVNGMKQRLVLQKARIPKPVNFSSNHRPCNSNQAQQPDNPEDAIAFSSNNGDTRTYQPRKWGGKPLPLSPIMDPLRIAQRNRHKERKPPPKHSEFTPFQKALYNNPYARALSTNVRRCQITQARVPSFFHLPFTIKPHPEPPNKPWLLPSKLYTSIIPNAPPEARGSDAQSYIQARRSMLRWLAGKKRWSNVMNQLQYMSLGSEKRKALVWRGDMEDFVLGLLRRAVLRSLRWGLQHPNAHIVMRCDQGAEGVQQFEGVACLLYRESLTSKWLRELQERVESALALCDKLVEEAVKIQWTAETKRGKTATRKSDLPAYASLHAFPPRINPRLSNPPLEFPTAQYKGGKISVYSMIDLLGEEKTNELLQGTVFEDARCLALKEDNLAVSAQEWLLKLQLYMT